MLLILYLSAAIVCLILYSRRIVFGRKRPTPELRSTSAVEAVVEAYRRGDYATALTEAEGLKDGTRKTPEYCFFRGKMLFELGQLSEAEASLRDALALERDERRMALSNEALGFALMEQERYDDAIDCFEGCIRVWPDRGCGHRAVAEAWLRAGGRTGEAVYRARRALEIQRKAPKLSDEIHNVKLSAALATLAWAVAADSADAAQVERLVEEAVPLLADEPKPMLAQVHFHAGWAYSILGEAEKSAYHFAQAMSVDPHGNFGRLARAVAPSGVAR